MKIRSRKELSFVLRSDMRMNRGYFKKSILRRFIEIFYPDYVMDYLYHMRTFNYMKDRWYLKPLCLYHKLRYLKLGLKLGYTIGDECLGYGSVFLHYGTIIVGGQNRIGNYSNLHTCTNIIDACSKIGDFFFLASGAKITKRITIGDNVMIGANSVVNKSFESNLLIAGTPAVIKKTDSPKWLYGGGYNLDSRWEQRYQSVERMKEMMNINF